MWWCSVAAVSDSLTHWWCSAAANFEIRETLTNFVAFLLRGAYCLNAWIRKSKLSGTHVVSCCSFLPSFLFCRQPWGVGLCPVYYAPCGCTAANCGMINAVIGLGIFFVLSQQVLFLDRFCNWMQLANFKIWLSAAYCGEVLMAAELQYRAMDVGYKVSYPHFTQTSHEEGLPETSWWQCKLWTHTKLISMV